MKIISFTTNYKKIYSSNVTNLYCIYNKYLTSKKFGGKISRENYQVLKIIKKEPNSHKIYWIHVILITTTHAKPFNLLLKLYHQPKFRTTTPKTLTSLKKMKEW